MHGSLRIANVQLWARVPILHRKNRKIRIKIRRRDVIAGGSSALLLAGLSRVSASPTPISVTKDANCGCCNGWTDHLREEGFEMTATDSTRLNQLKATLGVPHELASCHTAETGGYVIEGHVPASAIRKLLAERPEARGLAVPGMPIGSPGMEIEGQPAERYAVALFGPKGREPTPDSTASRCCPARNGTGPGGNAARLNQLTNRRGCSLHASCRVARHRDCAQLTTESPRA
ncbi:MAG: hypothetical protein K2Y27_07625 [Xanthobacteraceae bacterium]|nr:hypothetical protein [Xanthobacteraceae bacterium]